MSYEGPPAVPPVPPPAPGAPQTPPGAPQTPSEAAAPSRTLSVLALVFAILVPVAGLVLALIAGARARRAGRRQDGLTTAALIVSIVLTVVGLVALVVVAVVALTVLARGEPTVSPQDGDLVVTVTATDGDSRDSELRAAVDLVLAHRLERAGIQGALLAHGADGAFIVRLPSTATEADAAQAASLLAAPTDGGIARVLAVDEGGGVAYGTSTALTDGIKSAFEAVDCAQTLEGPVDVGGGLAAACSSDGSTRYLLGPVEIPAAAIDDVTTGSDASGATLQVDFGLEGAGLLADLTAEVVGQGPPDGLIAIVTGGDVLMAPRVMAAITDGSVQIAGGTVEELRELRAQLVLLARGAAISVDMASAAG